ncbi:hypothetical protein JKF63_07583 [Porcisia hertigi]|uniref:Uncharacterized protein n=1 Tax=Porcisia hertigi TaxID=2761500 RepID=A0A837A9B8_9TRYP|nr:hypothetical protein JKF63_07583 [Porcisia hertigi]
MSAFSSKATQVLCTYTTVFESSASRYYAVAPTKPYEKMFVDALTADITSMIAEGSDWGECCASKAPEFRVREAQRRKKRAAASPPPGTGGAVPTTSSSPLRPCVCLESITITDVIKYFNTRVELLGVTFQVKLSVWESVATVPAAPAGVMDGAGRLAQNSVLERDAAVASSGALHSSVAHRCRRHLFDTYEPASHPVPLEPSRAHNCTLVQQNGLRPELFDEQSPNAERRPPTRGLADGAGELGSTSSPGVVTLSYDHQQHQQQQQPQAMTPFVWSLPSNEAFPKFRQNLLWALTRRDYLSAYRRDVHVFAHVTLVDLQRMLLMEPPRSSQSASTAHARTASQALDPTGAALGTSNTPTVGAPHNHSRRTAWALAASVRDDRDYCSILVTSKASTILPPGSSVTQPSVTIPDGEASYPIALVHVVQDAYGNPAAKWSDKISSPGFVGAVVMAIIFLGAALKYVYQVWRLREKERAAERKLQQCYSR